MKSLFLIIFHLVLIAKASAQNSPFTYENLKEKIIQNKVTTIEQLLPLLPEKSRRNPMLVYSSHARNQYLVTPANPRVILFNDDVSLAMAYTQSPGADAVSKNLDSLEVIHFDKNKNVFQMENLILNGQVTPYENSQTATNPMMCLRCHGMEPRPIFQDYNGWPGFYGSFSESGAAIKGTPEYQNLLAFIASKDSKPRYKDLDLSLFKEHEKGIDSVSADKDFDGFTPLLIFGKHLQERMFDRGAQKIYQSAKYESVKPIIAQLGTSLDKVCGVELRERIKDAYKTWTADPAQKTAAQNLYAEIKKQILYDQDAKSKEFLLANKTEEVYDDRGLFSFPYAVAITAGDRYYKYDAEFFQNQLVLLESVYRYLGLNNESLTTDFRYPTLGVFHVREGLYLDEQYFLGLSESLKKIDPGFAALLKTDCAEIKKSANEQLLNLPVADSKAPGLLYRK